jgi:hypothetical protein
MHALATTKPHLPAVTTLTFGIACPRCTFMVRDLPSKDAVRIAFCQHTCVKSIPPMDQCLWWMSGLGWYLRGSDAVIIDGDRLTCRHCDKTVLDEKIVGNWSLAQDWNLTHALDCPGWSGMNRKILGCCGHQAASGLTPTA